MNAQGLFLQAVQMICTACAVQSQLAMYNNWNMNHIVNCLQQAFLLPASTFTAQSDVVQMSLDFTDYLIKQKPPAAWIPSSVVNK